MLSSCDFWTNLRFIMFMNFVMQTFVAPQCSCTCHFNVLMYQKASTKYDPISVIHCIKSLSPSWFALFFSLHVLHIISSSKFKYQTKIAQSQHGVSNWRCLLSSGLANQALTGILKTLQCDWIWSAKMSGPKFLHSAVKDSLPVITSAWMQLLLLRVAQSVIRLKQTMFFTQCRVGLDFSPSR